MSFCTSQEPLESQLLSFQLAFGTCTPSLATPRGQQTLGEAGLRAGYVPVGIFQNLGIIFMQRVGFCISFSNDDISKIVTNFQTQSLKREIELLDEKLRILDQESQNKISNLTLSPAFLS